MGLVLIGVEVSSHLFICFIILKVPYTFSSLFQNIRGKDLYETVTLLSIIPDEEEYYT